MRFRSASVADIPACIDLLRKDGGFAAEPEIWDALPALWQSHLLEDKFAGFQIYETTTRDGDYRPVAFRISGFVSKAFCDEYAANPHAQVSAEVWRRTLSGESPILDRDQVATGNAQGSLNLIVLHWLVRHRNPLHPETLRILTLASSGWQSVHLGYRLSLLVAYEVYGAAAAVIMQNIGYQRYKFADSPASKTVVPGKGKSTVFYWARENSKVGSGGMQAVAYLECPAPRYFFTASQQRLLIGALDGKPDKQMATELNIRYDTVRQSWEAMYKKVEAVDPESLPESGEGSGTRRTERRRVLVEYIRQHMEEVRPYDRRAAGDESERMLLD